jgi:uncharacterized membrane protein YdjX (TVP38/TMEM64 family)
MLVNSDKMKKFRKIWGTDLLIIFFFLLLVLVFVLWQPSLPSELDISNWSARLGASGPLALILTIILETVLAPIPGPLISIATGVVYGVWPGILYLWIGNMIGSNLSFWIARKLGRPLVRRLIKDKTIDSFDVFLRRNKLFIWLVYIIPIFPVDVIGYVLGLSDFPYKRYAAVIGLGFAINLFILTSFGDHLLTASGGVKFIYAIIIMVVLLAAMTVEKLITRKRKD